jgi:putative PIN family toxin of toxin-antitoxin system
VIRAVIDTNVLVSGLLSPTGNEALILLAIHQGLVHPCFTEDILEEYAAVLARPKFAFPPDEIAAVLAMFHNQGELFQPDVSGPVSSDPADTKFLHCAQAAQADYIVTGNKRDFPDAPYGVTRVVSAGELLDQITFEI